MPTGWYRANIDRWEQGFAALRKFNAREGHCLPSRYHVEGKFKLGQWVSVQRYLEDRVPAERKRRLDAIGFVWDWIDHRWEQGFTPFEVQETQRPLSRADLPLRRKLPTWMVGFHAAQK